uniref:carbonic anhydrase n=1 Tax=Cryptosporangium minutisporangium TaxID=113569 RepID=UPI00366B2539
QDGQQPDVVAVCCSDSRVPQERMWGVDDPGTVFTPSNIGNQVWDEDEGERIVDGGVLYPIHHAGTDAVAVVGHTGCGAVTAAYGLATEGAKPG